jgi:hypothetical protein
MENFPTSESEDKYKAIAEAKNFDQLLAAIDQLGSIEGSSKTYSAEMLKERINKVRDGLGIYIEGITRTGGLRDKVIELFSRDSALAPEN